MSTEQILSSSTEYLVEKILAVASEYEFDSFVLGIERPRDYRREVHETVFRQVKIDVGTRLSQIWPERRVDFDHPDVRFDVRSGKDILVIARAVPLFIGGRYLKHSREIPANRWKHMPCRGRGCRRCDFTGNVHGPSLQELSQPLLLAATGGEEVLFHGAGREDVDARMLGDGRPFVFEISRPLRRRLNLEELEVAINAAAAGYGEVRRLLEARREEVGIAKAAGADKTYRAWITFDGELPEDLDARLAELSGREVVQLSPTRVAHRRGKDTVRHKRIVSSRLVGPDGDQHVWEVRASSGTYIKELISGDGGRTEPSVAEVVGLPCHCVLLDVLAIHWEPPWETRARSRAEGELS